VDRIERSDGKFRLLLAGSWVDADHIVLACEAHQGARLTQSVDARISELLSTVGYRSSVTVALGFLRAAVREQMRGFGFLVPRRERRKLLACTWVGNKFPHRTPESLAVLRCFVGGAGGDAALAESDEAILDAVRQEVREIAGVAAEPLFWRVYRWPSSMAQYTVGHEERIRELEGRLDSLDGLYIAGNGYHGIGVPDCVRMGKRVAGRIAQVWTG
jgi:oxygen-dependent protoporphyrinogen oxidase